MNAPYKVAIIGRPNVGKSALFNRIVRRRKSIVEDVPGVTRDRIYGSVDVFGKEVEFIDTGGVDGKNAILFSELIREQAEIAIREADLILLTIDARTGITLQDEEVARLCLKNNKPVILAANKVDHTALADEMHNFYSLGISSVFPVSAIHGYGLADLLEEISRRAPEYRKEEEKAEKKVALIGRANVGKSTLFNALLQDHRQVVSEIPGTTRDAVDAKIGDWTFVDTAGVRRKKAEKESVDKFASIRTMNAIERADICLFVIDAYQGITTEEKRILTTIEEKGKACIIFLNKWDTVREVRMEHMLQRLRQNSPFLAHVPVIIGSAKMLRNVDKIFPMAEEVYANHTKRIGTGQLNTMLERAVQKTHPPMITGKRLRIYYLTQIDTAPPRFAFFVNYPERLERSYQRYLVNCVRKAYQFTGCPIQFVVRSRSRKQQKTLGREIN